VFLSSALEALLENALWDLLEIREVDHTVGELIMDGWSGRDRRIVAFNRLAGQPLSGILASAGFSQFIDQWQYVAKLRNRTVHGDLEAFIKPDPSRLEYIRDNCISAFVAVDRVIRGTKRN
jgi:hypothetical protein